MFVREKVGYADKAVFRCDCGYVLFRLIMRNKDAAFQTDALAMIVRNRF